MDEDAFFSLNMAAAVHAAAGFHVQQVSLDKTVEAARAKAARFESFGLAQDGIIGQGVLASPNFLLAPGPGEPLLVTDYAQNAVHRFAPDGRHLGRLDAELQEPMQCFADPTGLVWVCDSAHERIVAFAPDGRIADEIRFLPDPAPSGDLTRPVFGCAAHGRLWVMLSDPVQVYRWRMAEIRPDEPGRPVRTFPVPPYLRTPVGLDVRGGEVLVGERYSGVLCRLDAAAGEFVPLDLGRLPGEMMRFALHGGAACFTTRRHLALAMGDTTIRVAGFGGLPGPALPVVLGLAADPAADSMGFLLGDMANHVVRRVRAMAPGVQP